MNDDPFSHLSKWSTVREVVEDYQESSKVPDDGEHQLGRWTAVSDEEPDLNCLLKHYRNESSTKPRAGKNERSSKYVGVSEYVEVSGNVSGDNDLRTYLKPRYDSLCNKSTGSRYDEKSRKNSKNSIVNISEWKTVSSDDEAENYHKVASKVVDTTAFSNNKNGDKYNSPDQNKRKRHSSGSRYYRDSEKVDDKQSYKSNYFTNHESSNVYHKDDYKDSKSIKYNERRDFRSKYRDDYNRDDYSRDDKRYKKYSDCRKEDSSYNDGCYNDGSDTYNADEPHCSYKKPSSIQERMLSMSQRALTEEELKKSADPGLQMNSDCFIVSETDKVDAIHINQRKININVRFQRPPFFLNQVIDLTSSDNEEEPEVPFVELNKRKPTHSLPQTPSSSYYDSVKEQKKSLPIYRLKYELIKAIYDHQILIVPGETGSGKTTQIAQYMFEAGFACDNSVIACTQPRRVAAMSVARRVATEMDTHLGDKVGYTVRFDDRSSEETRIKYMTDGVLLKDLLYDPMVKDYSAVIVDEAHERTVQTDVVLALLKRVCKERPNFKLIVTSATLDKRKFSSYFNNAPVFSIPGRCYPVEVIHAPEFEIDENQPLEHFTELAIRKVFHIHTNEGPGDILVFLTGQEEIESCCERLRERLSSRMIDQHGDLIIRRLYSTLSADDQAVIFEPTPLGSRKVVVSTNIAETSLTIDGIKYVIDEGFVKQKEFSCRKGVDKLRIRKVSKAQAKQRQGRAGRTGPGKCFRLYSQNEYDSRREDTVPEIQRADLTPMVILLKAMGIVDLFKFDFLDKPPEHSLESALKQIWDLNALDDSGVLTCIGDRMSQIPLKPKLCKVLIMSVHLGCSEEILTIVSMLSCAKIFVRPQFKEEEAKAAKKKFQDTQGDHFAFLRAYDEFIASGKSKYWCDANFVSYRNIMQAHHVRKQLLRVMERRGLDVVSAGDNKCKIQQAICSGFFRNAAKNTHVDGYRKVTDKRKVYIHPGSACFAKRPEWVVFQDLVETSKEYMHEVMPIDPRWLIEFAPKVYELGVWYKRRRNKKKWYASKRFKKN